MSPVTSPERTQWTQRLAAAMVGAGLLPAESAAPLVEEAVSANTPLAVLVIGRGLAPAAAVVTTLARIAELPPVDLESERPAPEVRDLVPGDVAREHRAVGLRAAGKRLVVVFAEPPTKEDLVTIGECTGYEIVPALGDPLVIESLLGGRANGTSPDWPVGVLGAEGETAGTPNGKGGRAGALPPPPPPSAGNRDRDPRPGASAPPPPPIPAPPLSLETAAAVGGSVTDRNGLGAPPGIGPGGTSVHIDDLLRYAVGIGSSDLHLTVNMPPTVRLHGALRPLEDVARLDNDTLREMVYGILTQGQREQFEEEHELDTSHSIPGVGRFRVNVCLQRGTIAVALRPIPHDVPEFTTLGVPESVAGFANLRRGLVLVTGPTGSGKSTTLASLIDIINRTKPLHIVTVEDPIEFLHSHKRSIISQREVGEDTTSFAEALRRALRQDPDVILVGEMRDLETIATALTASETGHLVFATLHTQDAPSTVDRIIDVFPPNQQDQIRIQLGSALAGVVTQQLVPTVDGRGRAVATEILICTPGIQNLIRAAKTHQIFSLMQTGGQYGMQTMDQSLALLVKQGAVSQAVAADRCRNEEDFRNHLSGV